MKALPHLNLDRRNLFKSSALILFSGTVVQLLPYGNGKALACINDVTGEIARNHGHIALIPEASLSLNELTIDIKGQGTHSHILMLTQEQLLALAQHKSITVESSEVGGHTHAVTFFAVQEVVGEIGSNHGHEAVISAVQLNSDQSVTLSIQGTGTHDHQVTLSDVDLRAVRSGWKVTKESTVAGGHKHSIVFN